MGNGLEQLQAYFDSYHRVEAYRSRYPDENVIRFLVASFGKGERQAARVLDLGCGCGRHLTLLAELGFQPYGVDFSPVALSVAKENLEKKGLSAELAQASVDNLPYPDNYFNAFIEHATLVNNSWPVILQTCREAQRVLVPGGVGFMLLKRREDCAFDVAREVAPNEFISDESVYLSRAEGHTNLRQTFHAFTRSEIEEMCRPFSKVKIHTWDQSFKSLNIDEEPGKRLTAYWIVIVQK